MIDYIKHGINNIKSTKQYAREKNVTNWFNSLLGAIYISFIASTVLTLYSILFVSIINPSELLIRVFSSTVLYYPIILSFFIMMSIGKHLIKFMIYFTYIIQKLIMKGLNKLDMYLWKKTGKDSLATSFVVKHRKIIQIMAYTPLIIMVILRHLPK